MSPTPHIRDAGAEDVEAMARIEALAAPHPWSTEALRATLLFATTRARVAVCDEVHAHLVASIAADIGEILTLAVHPEWQRRGLASALLADCLDGWRGRAVREAFLEVAWDNTPARTLYGRCGWQIAGRRPGYYRDGTDALVLRLELG